MKGIVAISENWGIGRNNVLPWPSIKSDFAWFKKSTLNQSIIVGRTTAKDLPPLPNRFIYTLSSKYADPNNLETDLWGEPIQRTYNTNTKGDFYVNHYIHKIEQAPADSWLCGGASIYKQFLHLCDELYVTHVNGVYECDTYFPFSLVQITHLFPYVTKIHDLDGGHKIVRYSKNES